MFDEYVSKSNINVEENRKTAKEYRSADANAKNIKKKLSRFCLFRVLLIVLAVMSAVFLIFSIVNNQMIFIGVSIASLVVSLLIVFTLINKKIKELKSQLQKAQQIANDLYNKALNQMQSVIELFDSEATKQLIEKTVPTLKLDKRFEMKRYDYMSGKYGLMEANDDETSTIGMLSGEIHGNPFLFERTLHHYMGMQTYTGTLTISWTTYYRDSKGNTCRRTHTQVLHAHVNKPKPFYQTVTTLVYGNDAAPNLTFSHNKTHAETWGERKLRSKVESRIKKIRKKAVKNISSGFTEMGNEEFDALFGAFDRDNEVQFRLLFTPLAQKNMLDIIKGGTPYGDDFNFYKDKNLNYIVSDHAQSWDMDTRTDKYISYDVDLSKKLFTDFNSEYFKNFFFDLAPLLSIPLYQQIKPKEYIYKTEYKRNYTAREAELIANKFPKQAFSHPHTRTNTILKTELVDRSSKIDSLNVIAYSYRTIRRVDFIPVFGGDGKMHAVPVPWIEYIPITKQTEMSLKEVNITDKEFRNSEYAKKGDMSLFYHDLVAGVGEDGLLFDSLPDELENDDVDYSDVVEELDKKIENIDDF